MRRVVPQHDARVVPLGAAPHEPELAGRGRLIARRADRRVVIKRATAGVRAWDQQARIVLKIGPLDLPYFERLLPHRPLLRELASLVRAFVGFEVGFAINPVLARDAVPPLMLSNSSAKGATGAGPMLGWNTWLPTSPITPRRTDASESLFEGDIVEGLA